MVALVTKDLPTWRSTTFRRASGGFCTERQRHILFLRGLRASQFPLGFVALVNRKLAGDRRRLGTVPSEEYSYLSSTIIKDVAPQQPRRISSIFIF